MPKDGPNAQKLNNSLNLFFLKRDSFFLTIKGKSDNGNQLYLHYKYDSSNLSFSNFILIIIYDV